MYLLWNETQTSSSYFQNQASVTSSYLKEGQKMKKNTEHSYTRTCIKKESPSSQKQPQNLVLTFQGFCCSQAEVHLKIHMESVS